VLCLELQGAPLETAGPLAPRNPERALFHSVCARMNMHPNRDGVKECSVSGHIKCVDLIRELRRSLKYPHRQKSHAGKSGEHGGHKVLLTVPPPLRKPLEEEQGVPEHDNARTQMYRLTLILFSKSPVRAREPG